MCVVFLVLRSCSTCVARARSLHCGRGRLGARATHTHTCTRSHALTRTRRACARAALSDAPPCTAALGIPHTYQLCSELMTRADTLPGGYGHSPAFVLAIMDTPPPFCGGHGYSPAFLRRSWLFLFSPLSSVVNMGFTRQRSAIFRSCPSSASSNRGVIVVIGVVRLVWARQATCTPVYFLNQ